MTFFPAAIGVGHHVDPGHVAERDVGAGGIGPELEPGLHLEEPAIGIIGEVLLDDIVVRRLRILHELAAAVAVDIDNDVAAVEPGDAERPQEGIGQLLPLE